MSRYSWVRSAAVDKFSRLEISSQGGSSTQTGSATEMCYDSGGSNGTLRCSILPNAMDRVMELVTETWVREQAFERHPSEVVQSATDKELRQ